MKDVEGIVLKEQPYSETSKLLKILTKEGIIDLIAKGARTLKSDLRSVTTKMTYGMFHIHYKEDKLSTLISVDIIDSLKNIKKDIIKISYASFLMELASQVMKQNNDEQIYFILISSLKKINENYDPLIISNIVELKYLDYLGVMPVLDSCALCGSKTNIVTISGNRGGYICANCFTNERMVEKKTIQLLRMLYYVDIDKITSTNIQTKIKKEINDFIDEYYELYTGLYLQTKSFLKNLNKI